ncbi:MAG: class I mannose-6-phosphate isomerase [Acidimicrobiia bacterium]|nr:class I mannose-6-phosphate isomerase [Acidimicrobiia bacterium]
MLYPMILEPILAPKPWGGDRLAAYGKAVAAGDRIGESWEVADLDLDKFGTVPFGKSQVVNGPLAGETLRGLMTENGIELLGTAARFGQFPLLIKLLDAREPLSVQVHPTSDYVAHHPDTHMKTESWYVVEAEPEAVIFKGFRPGTQASDIARTAGTPELVGYLQTIPVSAGDIHHLPAGTIHALGAGVLVAEVQTPSDTTFRLYDWTEELNRPERPLQIAEALACLDYADPPQADPIELGPTVRSLIHTDHYWIHEHRSPVGTLTTDASPGLRVFMVLTGTVAIGAVSAGIGSTVLVPASTPSVVRAETTAIVLEIGLAR